MEIAINFYPFHIGDYMAHTAHLEPMEDLAYRRMIDLYYTREDLLPADPAEVAKLIRMRGYLDVVKSVLLEFFTNTEIGWLHKRCDYEISEMQSKRSKAQDAAAKRWGSERNANAMPGHMGGNATNTNTNTNTKGEPKTIVGSYPEEFEEVWSEYPNRPGANKRGSYKAWSARIKDGVAAEKIIEGTRRYAAYCRASGVEAKYIKQPATFFGPDEHYLSEWPIQAQARASPMAVTRAESRERASILLTGRTRQDEPREREITGEVISIAG